MSESSFALRGATILPVTADPVKNGVIVVENGRISAVGGPDLPVSEGVPSRTSQASGSSRASSTPTPTSASTKSPRDGPATTPTR